MKRSDLEKKAIDTLEEQGYTCERAYNKAVFIPGKGYVGTRFDFFHVIDILAIRGNEIRMIQVTSENAKPDSKHHSKNGSDSEYDHVKKIEKYWHFEIPVELWIYEKIKNRWVLRVQSYIKGTWFQGIIDNVISKHPEVVQK